MLSMPHLALFFQVQSLRRLTVTGEAMASTGSVLLLECKDNGTKVCRCWQLFYWKSSAMNSPPNVVNGFKSEATRNPVMWRVLEQGAHVWKQPEALTWFGERGEVMEKQNEVYRSKMATSRSLQSCPPYCSLAE
jgi:hypothetical protein